jgi:hypothetical protein
MQAEFGNPDKPDEDDADPSEDDNLELDDEGEADPDEDTVVYSPAKNSDNVGDVSVEINVEELIAEIESSATSEAARKKEVRRRLEEIREQKEAMRELEDTFSLDPGEDD